LNWRIITPIPSEDELIRQEYGFTAPQNYNFPLRSLSKRELLSWLKSGKRKRFFNHATSQYIRENIGEEIWNSYYKFTFERNPYDKAISRYYWSTREPRPPIDEYLETAPIELLSNWNIYTINDQIAVDFIGQYQNLTNDLAMIAEKLSLPGSLSLPRAKGGYRKNKAHYSALLNEKSRKRIEIVCAKEIQTFGYTWQNAPE
jgi:hypothetical protein